ncbi:pentapeptide repeat-containing protein [Leptolyngbya sp. FACHB-671]|uniref:pentapeptide repeat-containing protein n=1 Tax=Leptolyngbya sp. FACHB-671 TaxID=2692812 RepID=UPI001689CD93|nr:pentapeptide repeat-containing protein [Leptolyngbya sp. FACHB-671]MBD2069798.1 pentapeptide repeat-containing protein [Leptolyngbya sp. FACHB-671]
MLNGFSNANLQGRSFKGQNLANTNFRGTDIRGTDFSNTILTGADFSNAKAGLQHHWAIGLAVVALLLTIMAGFIIAYTVALTVQVLENGIDNFFFLRLLPLAALTFFLTITIKRGLGSALGLSSAVVIAIVAITAAVAENLSQTEQIIAVLIVKTLAIAGAGAGILAGAVSIGVLRNTVGSFAIALASPGVIVGGIAGAILGISSKSRTLTFDWILEILITIGLVALSTYIGFRALAEDRKYLITRTIVVTLSTLGGTNFRGADLTDANFTKAILKNVDLRNANLKRTNWLLAEKLDQSQIEGTYLENLQVRRLVISKNGQDKNFDYFNLRGLNLEGANLADASFIGADLSESTLQNADLSRAKLVQTQLYRVNLTDCCLTGACIQDWAISTDTKLDGVRCEFIYMRLPTKDDPDPWRKPDNRRETFEEGDFSDFIAPIVKTLDLYRQQNVDPRQMADTFKTLDLYHYEGIDPSAAAIALKQLAEQHPEAGLEVVALEGRGEEKIRLQARVTGKADQSQLNAEYFEKYKEVSSLPYSDLQALLAGIAEKDERIRSLETMVMTAINSNKSYIETYYSLGDTVSEKSSINIEAGGNIGNVSGVTGGDISGVLNLGTISGNVTNAINQLPDSSDPDEPGIKELLLQLQAAIETEPELAPEDKVEALEQVKVLAEAGQKPEDGALQKTAKTAMKILKGTVAGLPEVTKLVQESAKLLPAIVTLLALI